MASEALNRLTSLTSQIGRAGVSALYPNEFEYYLLALELSDSSGNTIDYFVFPIMPESISRDQREIKTIEKTLSGIVTTRTSTFVPVNFAISGSFGRQLKFMLGNKQVSFTAAQLSANSGVFSRTQLGDNPARTNNFDTSIKSGYGACKVLQAILDKSNSVGDDGKPLRLSFYNPAFGESYVVESTNFQFTQNFQSNMIWEYSIQFTAVAPLGEVVATNPKSLLALTAISAIGNSISEIAQGLKRNL